MTLDSIEAKILEVLKDKYISVDALLDLIDEDGGTIIEKISIMELEGKIVTMPGGRISASVF
ncbi:MAG: hypothetical protein Q8930_15595 [Bacillota bacterium]|nr:hypothetical protein [Bacillota bacterium]